MLAAEQKAANKECAMSNVTIGSVALFSALIGGIALIQIRPTIGPFNFNRESPLLSEDDEQRARALRIAVERRAEKAAERRIEAEQKAEETARLRVIHGQLGTVIKTESGDIYAILCRGGPSSNPESEFYTCLTKALETQCPVRPPYRYSSQNEWSVRYRNEGWLLVC